MKPAYIYKPRPREEVINDSIRTILEITDNDLDGKNGGTRHKIILSLELRIPEIINDKDLIKQILAKRATSVIDYLDSQIIRTNNHD